MSLLGYERGESAATTPIRFQAELDRLLMLAKERGVDQDPIIRQRLAWCYSKVQIMRYLGMRMLTQFLAGHEPGPGRRPSRSCTGASTTRSSPSWPSTSSAPTR